MARFVVQVENWGDWEDVESFDDPSDGKQYAKDNYPHNAWRIWDNQQGLIILLHEHGLALAVSQDIERFRRADLWLERLVENRTRNNDRRVEARSTFGNILGVANRQRTYDHHRPFHFDEYEDVEENEPQHEKVCWQKDGF